MFEDMVRMDIPNMVVSNLHGFMINLLLVVKSLEIVRTVTGRYVTFLFTFTWTMNPPILGSIINSITILG